MPRLASRLEGQEGSDGSSPGPYTCGLYTRRSGTWRSTGLSRAAARQPPHHVCAPGAIPWQLPEVPSTKTSRLGFTPRTARPILSAGAHTLVQWDHTDLMRTPNRNWPLNCQFDAMRGTFKVVLALCPTCQLPVRCTVTIAPRGTAMRLIIDIHGKHVPGGFVAADDPRPCLNHLIFAASKVLISRPTVVLRVQNDKVCASGCCENSTRVSSNFEKTMQVHVGEEVTVDSCFT